MFQLYLRQCYNAMLGHVRKSPDVDYHEIHGVVILTYKTANIIAGNLAWEFARSHRECYGVDKVESRQVGDYTEIFLPDDS